MIACHLLYQYTIKLFDNIELEGFDGDHPRRPLSDHSLEQSLVDQLGHGIPGFH